MEAIDHYLRLLESGVLPPTQMCLTWVGPADVDEALVRFDGFPARRVYSVQLLDEWFPPGHVKVVLAGRFGDGVLLVDPHGRHGIQRAVLERLSAGAVAATLHYSDYSSGYLAYAEDGRMLSFIHDFDAGGADTGARPSAVAGFLDGLDFAPGLSKAAGLLFLERVAGARLTVDWLQDEHPASVIVEPKRFEEAKRLSELLPGVDDRRWSPQSRAGDPLSEGAQEVFRAAAADRVAVLRAAADLAVARVAPAGATGATDPIAAARESFRQGVEWYWEEPEDDDAEPTGGGIETYFADQGAEEEGEAAAEEAMRRAYGWASLHAARRTDPRDALRAVLTQAREADPEGWPELQREIGEMLSASGR